MISVRVEMEDARSPNCPGGLAGHLECMLLVFYLTRNVAAQWHLLTPQAKATEKDVTFEVLGLWEQVFSVFSLFYPRSWLADHCPKGCRHQVSMQQPQRHWRTLPAGT